jgi:hypothetical protein
MKIVAGQVGYSEDDLDSIGVYTQQFPYPCFKMDRLETRLMPS